MTNNGVDAFKLGYRHGMATKAYVSRRQVAEQFPAWNDDTIDRYLNGRDDGVAGDDWRLRQRAAQLALELAP
jgi:hypothetical protein